MYRAQYFELKRLQILAKETVYHSKIPTGEKISRSKFVLEFYQCLHWVHMTQKTVEFHDELITSYMATKVNSLSNMANLSLRKSWQRNWKRIQTPWRDPHIDYQNFQNQHLCEKIFT